MSNGHNKDTQIQAKADVALRATASKQ